MGNDGGEGGLGGELEPEATSFVPTGADTPVKARVGLFLVGAALVAAVLIAVG